MAHFAVLDQNNVVVNVVKIGNDDIENLPFPESESLGIEFLKDHFDSSKALKQTSYNHNFRFRYAQIGGTYDPVNDVFLKRKMFPSWVLDPVTFEWVPPIPYPPDYATVKHWWDEATCSWILPPDDTASAT